MFDPSVGRWMEVDPIGFMAGDLDLYRYLGNNPTNGTDPSGLQAQQQPNRELQTYAGKEEPIRNHTFDIPGGQGSVWIYKNVGLINRKGQDRGKGWIQFSFTANTNIGPEWHWVQYVWREFKLHGQNRFGAFPSPLKDGTIVWHLKGEEGDERRFIDFVSRDVRNPPYIDVTVPENTRRLPTELTFVDRVNYDPTARKYDEQIAHFNTFLVNTKEKKVYFHIQWIRYAKRIGDEWKADYYIQEAKPTNEVPKWARTETFHHGWRKLDDDDNPVEESEIRYPNPLYGYSKE